MLWASIRREGMFLGGMVLVWTILGSSAADAAQTPPWSESVGIESTDPIDGYIDPRTDTDEDGNPVGLTEFTVTFTDSVRLTVNSLCVEATGGEAPTIAAVTPLDDTLTSWRVRLDSPIPTGETTQFTFVSGHAFAYTFLPGDINQDGSVTAEDKFAMLDALKFASDDASRYDINRDGTVGAEDYGVLVSKLAEGVCCEVFGVCCSYLAKECPKGTSEVECPCPPI